LDGNGLLDSVAMHGQDGTILHQQATVPALPKRAIVLSDDDDDRPPISPTRLPDSTAITNPCILSSSSKVLIFLDVTYSSAQPLA
jgi:hypothetical protein